MSQVSKTDSVLGTSLFYLSCMLMSCRNSKKASQWYFCASEIFSYQVISYSFTVNRCIM